MFPSEFWKTGNYICGITFLKLYDDVYERKLGVFDSKFNVAKYFYTDKVDYSNRDLNQPHYMSLSVSHDKLVYVPEYSPSKYEIDVFDLNGNKKRVIRKNYISIPYTPEELKYEEDDYKQYGIKVKGTLKNSINFIQIDKEDRLWVRFAIKGIDNKNQFDVFKDGVYLNTVKIKSDNTVEPWFFDEKVMFFDPKNKKVTFYNY